MDVREFQSAKRNPRAPRHPWEQTRVHIIHKLIAQYGLPNRPTLIDIGSGDGYVLQSLSANALSHRPIAIDQAYSNPMILDALKQHWNVETEWYPDWNLIHPKPQEACHLLLMDVLEHIENDKQFLQDLYLWAPPGTMMFVTVPADPDLFGKHDHQLGHFRRYGANQLKNTSESAGWHTVNAGGFFSSLWVVRKWQKWRGQDPDFQEAVAIENWNQSEGKTKLINLILRTDHQINRFLHRFGIELPTLSRFLICYKPQ